MSVWRDVESLNDYVYRSAHVELMRRRKQWFERMDQAFLVLWWVPKGHRPSVAEAIAKLQLLRAEGPSAQAFSFRQTFPPPDATAPARPVAVGDSCPRHLIFDAARLLGYYSVAHESPGRISRQGRATQL